MALWVRYVAVVFALVAGFDAVRGAGHLGTAAAQAFYLPTHPWLARCCLLGLAGALLLVAFRPPRSPAGRAALLAGLTGLAALGVSSVIGFFRMRAGGQISSPWPVPFALLSVLLPLGAALWLLRGAHPPGRPGGWAHARAAVGVGASLFCMEVLYIHAFGLTDYRRPAAAILVLGAKVHEDGTPSEALAERVNTGVELYRQGLSPVLVMSGGVGREGHDEAAVMKRMAVRMGVPESAIVEDGQGNNTEASLVNVRAWLGGRAASVLVVSHYHHLPRVKLLGQRHGVLCYTVPADEGSTLLAGTPYYVVREAAALAYYYLRG